jgi:hypothetical protein
MRRGGTALEYPLKTVPPRPSEHQAEIAAAHHFTFPVQSADQYQQVMQRQSLCGGTSWQIGGHVGRQHVLVGDFPGKG